MTYSSSTTYNFTAFTEADLLAAGSGNGNDLGYGDTFTMPGCASVEFSVTDNDNSLSGDSRYNENSNDKYGQQASITQNGQEIGNGGQIYAEGYFWLCDQHGNWYLLIEIEQEGGSDDFFAFHEGYGIPPAGAELTVYCGGNISCWEPKFDDLTAGEVKSGPEAVNDMIAITEDESIGDASDDAQLNILANDSDATLATVNGLAPGEELTVTTAGGVEVKVTVDAAGNLSFDTNGLFEDLKDNESDSFTVNYTVNGPAGGEAMATATVQINGVSEADAVNDCFVVNSDEGEGDVDGNVLANDKNDFGALKVVSLTIDGETKAVGEWFDLADGGRVRLDADGNLDFDADGDFDNLLVNATAEVTFDYSIGREVSTGQTEYKCLSFNGLTRGTIITDQFASDGLRISSANSANPVMIFDTANPTGNDQDLRTDNLREVLILSTDGNSNNPNDHAGGGTFIFEFEREATVKKLTFLDTEQASTIRFYDVDGNLITTRTGPTTADGGQARKWFGVENVARMEVDMVSSGALDNLVYELAPATETVIDDTATAKIVVNGLLDPNAPPVAEDNVYATDQNTEIMANFVLDADEFNGVDSDPDGDTLTVTEVIVNGGAIAFDTATTVTMDDGLFTGTLTIATDGSYTFTPGADMVGLGATDNTRLTFKYTITDGEDEATAEVRIEIAGRNDGPVAQNNAYVTDQNTAISNNFILDDDAVAGQDADDDGDALTATEVIVNGAAIAFDTATTVTTDDGLFSGTLTVSADGSYAFTPGADMIALGVDDTTRLTFDYTITDGSEDASAQVTIDIAGLNDDPTAEDNFYVVTEDAAAAVIGNIVTDPGGDAGAIDSDPDNDPLAVKSVQVGGTTFLAGETFFVTSTTLMQEVAVTVGSDGSLTFDDQGNFDALNSGETDIVTFEYTVQDGNGGEDNANVTVTILGEDDTPPQVEYNILFLVDASSGLDDGNAHGLFLFTPPADLNGDGNFNTVLDAELATVQQFVTALGALNGFSTDVEIGVQTFTSNSNLRTPNDQNTTLTNNAGDGIFTSGDDLSEAFAGAGGDGGVAIWNTAIAGANDFFDFNSQGSGEVVNLLYILSDSEGTQQTVFPQDQPLATELAELQADHDVTIDTIIYFDTDQPNQFLSPIEASGGDGVINVVENQFDLNALLGNPLLDNLGIL